MTGLRTRAAALARVAGAAFAVPATPAQAAACSSGSGVTVVVDFASLGGGSQTRCAAGDPESGVTALRGAGFEPTRAAQQPGYFVCRIDGKPATDPCQRTSPEDAYWSYWHGRPGGSWTYSSLGPADYDPAPGTVEGWAFGAGKPPSSGPPAAASPSPAPSPAARSVPPSPQPVRSAAVAATAAPPTAPTPPKPASPAAGPTGPPTSPATAVMSAPPVVVSATPSPAAAPQPGAAPDAAPVSDAGSTTGPLLAGLVLAALAAAGARQVWLRRRGR